MVSRVGMITIGQSPRPDVVPEVVALVGRPMHVTEAGALDGLSLEAVRGLAPGASDETLVTRMVDGTEVHVAKRHIIPRLQGCIDRLAPAVDAIVLLCTGRFPEFHCPRPLLEPQGLVDRVLQAVAGPGGAVGVLVPGAAQVECSRRQMVSYGLTASVEAASPYAGGDEVRRAAERLRHADVSVIVMHCIGYTGAMKAEVRRLSGKPVLLARSIVGKVLEELL
jgi:protein AroM